MMLIEQTTVPAAALPVAEFKDHLRLGTGFADDGAEDGVVEALLRAALAAIEARTGKALLSRSYTWTLTAWRGSDSQALPVAPVSAITSLKVIDRQGAETVIASTDYRLIPDTHRPKLEADGVSLPVIPMGGSVEVVFDAGFGADWSAVPADLAQAVFLLAGHYFEHRQESASRHGAMPFGVASLIERWRTVRMLGGQA